MFSQNLYILRKQKGMSQETLAQQLNVVRQTISKWEKGLSVPDAEMLTRISDLFEVPVNELLGTKLEADKDINEIAAQLALLNEQLAGRSRRNKRIWKTIFIVLGIVLAICFSVSILSFILLTNRTSNTVTQTTRMVCTLEEEEYIYEITYDEQYQVIEAGGNAFIADHVNTEQYSDANILMAQIENFFWEQGGTCERIEVE
ncbi:MAG: helix-turn-helix transcriptional regulator [Lachnospiraceae bacterium]|nr:helix-turn-helix transcriptional regulator [Lachnospiraceae bacterium]